MSEELDRLRHQVVALETDMEDLHKQVERLNMKLALALELLGDLPRTLASRLEIGGSDKRTITGMRPVVDVGAPPASYEPPPELGRAAAGGEPPDLGTARTMQVDAVVFPPSPDGAEQAWNRADEGTADTAALDVRAAFAPESSRTGQTAQWAGEMSRPGGSAPTRQDLIQQEAPLDPVSDKARKLDQALDILGGFSGQKK